MQGKRRDRVGHLVQMELSQLILTRLKDPRLGFITVTRVDMTPDLKSAMVYYSVIGDEKVREDSAKALEKAGGYLQKQIAAQLKLRFTPKLQFRFDHSLDQRDQVDRILRDIKDKEQPS